MSRSGSGRFQRGTSGNPGGLPAYVQSVRLLAGQKAPRALTRLAEMMEDPDMRIALPACLAILDRAGIRPVDVHVNLGNRDPVHDRLVGHGNAGKRRPRRSSQRRMPTRRYGDLATGSPVVGSPAASHSSCAATKGIRRRFTSSGRSIGARWPAPSIHSKRAPATAAAMFWLSEGG